MRKALILSLMVSRSVCAQAGTYTFTQPSGHFTWDQQDFVGGQYVSISCSGSVSPAYGNGVITASFSSNCSYDTRSSTISGTITLTVPSPTLNIDNNYLILSDSNNNLGGPNVSANVQYQASNGNKEIWIDYAMPSVPAGSDGYNAAFYGCSKSGAQTESASLGCKVGFLYFSNAGSKVGAVLNSYGIRVGIANYPVPGFSYFDVIANYSSIGCGGTSGNPCPDLAIDHVEFVQATQNPTNGVKLVAYKDTMMRVFPKVVGSNQSPLKGVTATVKYTPPGGTEVTQAINGAVTANVPPVSRADLSQSLNFVLPLSITLPGASTFKVALNYPGSSDPNPMSPDRTATVTQVFQAPAVTNPVTIGWIPICLGFLESLGAQTLESLPVCPDGGLGDYDTFASKIFPMPSSPGANFQYSQAPPRALVYSPIPIAKFVPTFVSPGGENPGPLLAAKIMTFLNRLKFVLDQSGLYDRVFAWLPFIRYPFLNISVASTDYLPADLVRDVAFAIDTGSREALSFSSLNGITDHESDGGSGSQVLFAHWLARALGVPLIPAVQNTGEVGIDVDLAHVSGPGAPDFLSSLDKSGWISPQDWQALGLALDTLPAGSAPGPFRISATPGPTEYARITGTVQQDNSSGQIDPVLRLMSTVSYPAASTTGAYCLQVGNGTTTLAMPCFDVSFAPDPSGAIPQLGTFSVTLPWPTGATRVLLMHGSTQLAALAAGSGTPTVSITSPHQGDQWNGANTISWTASEPGATITSTLLYSYDGGITWLPLALDTTDSQYLVDTTMIKGGSQVLFRVIASDGIDNGVATVGPITINQTPVIQAPPGVDFGTQVTGQWADLTATLSNAGSGPLTIQSLATDDTAFTVLSPVTPFDILGGGSRAVDIRFLAGASLNGNLIVTSNDPVHGTLRIPLVARISQSALPNVVLPPATVNFGDVGVGQTADATINIVNNGSAVLNVAGGPPTGPFSITAGAPPFVVPPYGQQPVTLRFAPTSVGSSQMGMLSMSTDDSVHPSITVSLVGNGVTACAYSLSAASANPGSTASTGSVNLTAGATCSWAVASNAGWLTSSVSFGTGSSTINYSVAANSSGAPRTAILSIGDQTFTVTQASGSAPVLGIAMSHNPASFTQGQTGSFTITVSNTGLAATSTGVTVIDTLPTGLTATAISGTGWSCTAPSGPCTRSDTLPQGSSYPLITLAVNIAGNAPASVTNSVTVSGGGAPSATATDIATIVGTTLRTLVYHEITSLTTSANRGGAAAPVLSKNGTRAVFTTGNTTPIQVFVVNADGNSAPTLVDSYNTLCGCTTWIFISDDGSAVVSSDSKQIRYAPASGSGGQTVVTIGTASTSAIRLSADGGTVYFSLIGDGTINGASATKGVYAVSVNGSGLHQIVSASAVDSALGTSADMNFGDGSLALVDSSADNSKIIFNVSVFGAGSYLMGVNANGQNLHKLVGPLVQTYDAGISADGSTVYYNVVPLPSGPPNPVGVMNFDGSNNRVLDTGLDGTGRPGQITTDGSQIYIENGGRVYRTDGSGFYELAVNNPGATSHPVAGSFNASMNATGTRFLYLTGDASGISQLATIDVNPSSTGAAPSIGNPAINPPFVLVNGGSSATVTANVRTAKTLLGVTGTVLKNNGPDPNISGQPMYDDATHGDATAADGIFTNNAIRTDCCAAAGPRTVRIQAEDRAGTRRHATAVDLPAFSVVTSIPTTPITIGTNPPGRTFTVDGTSYTASQTLNLNQGSTHTIAVGTAPQAGGAGTQYLFTNWSDSGAASHSITVGTSATTYTANFKTDRKSTRLNSSHV